MKQEDLQKALEAISKSGITVAGDLVLEKHVEYEVNNVEDGGIGIQIVHGVSQKDGSLPESVASQSFVTEAPVVSEGELTEKLKPLFYNNEEDVRLFLKEISGMPPNDVTDLVNRWVGDKRISDYGNSRKGTLWSILNDAGLYMKSRQNWNRRVF